MATATAEAEMEEKKPRMGAYVGGLEKLTPATPIPRRQDSTLDLGGVRRRVVQNRFCPTRMRCRVHPVVILTMLDSHGRLGDFARFSIATLLGTTTSVAFGRGRRGASVVVDVLDCFVTPIHVDGDTSSLTIQKEHVDMMHKLREKTSPKLSVVGWCCTTSKMHYTTGLSDWARMEFKTSRFVASKSLVDPIHITIDTAFEDGGASSFTDGMRAYVRGPLRLLFHEIPLEFTIAPSMQSGVAAILANSNPHSIRAVKSQDPPAEAPRLKAFQEPPSRLAAALRQLQALLQPFMQYVDDVLAREREGDTRIGRELLRAIAINTFLSPQELETMFQGCVQDGVMVAHLAGLVKLQFAAAERMCASFAAAAQM